MSSHENPDQSDDEQPEINRRRTPPPPPPPPRALPAASTRSLAADAEKSTRSDSEKNEARESAVAPSIAAPNPGRSPPPPSLGAVVEEEKHHVDQTVVAGGEGPPQFYFTQRRRSQSPVVAAVPQRCRSFEDDQADFEASRRIAERGVALSRGANSFSHAPRVAALLSPTQQSQQRQRRRAVVSPTTEGSHAAQRHTPHRDRSPSDVAVEVESLRFTPSHMGGGATPELHNWAVTMATPPQDPAPTRGFAPPLRTVELDEQTLRSISTASTAVVVGARSQPRDTHDAATSPIPIHVIDLRPPPSLHDIGSPLAAAAAGNRERSHPPAAADEPQGGPAGGFDAVRQRLAALRREAADELRDQRGDPNMMSPQQRRARESTATPWRRLHVKPFPSTAADSQQRESSVGPEQRQLDQLQNLIAERQRAAAEIANARRTDAQATRSAAVRLPWGHSSPASKSVTKRTPPPPPPAAASTADIATARDEPPPLAMRLFAEADVDQTGYIRRLAAYKKTHEYFAATGAVDEYHGARDDLDESSDDPSRLLFVTGATTTRSQTRVGVTRSPPPATAHSIPASVLQREFDAAARSMQHSRPPARDAPPPGSIDASAFQQMLDAVAAARGGKRRPPPSVSPPPVVVVAAAPKPSPEPSRTTPVAAATGHPQKDSVTASTGSEAAALESAEQRATEPSVRQPSSATGAQETSDIGSGPRRRELSPEAITALKELSETLANRRHHQQSVDSSTSQQQQQQHPSTSPKRALSLAAQLAITAARRQHESRSRTASHSPVRAPPVQAVATMTSHQSRSFLASCLAADRNFDGRLALATTATFLCQCGVFFAAATADQFLVMKGLVEADGNVEYTNVATVLRSSAH